MEFNLLREFAIQSNEWCFNTKRVFQEKTFNLYETTLKFVILFKTTQVDEELSLRVNMDLEFIKETQRIVHQDEHNFRIMEQEEFRQRRMEIKYWVEIFKVNKNKVEELFLF